jgi:tetratricopeptide (TPR) repeat protein
VDAAFQLGLTYVVLGQFGKALETFGKAMLASPYDPGLHYWYAGQAWANFGLKRYDQAIELARRAIAINPKYNPIAQASLVAALAFTGHDAEAREALQRYLALPSTGPLKTIAAWKAYYNSWLSKQGGDHSRDGRTAERRPAQGRDAGGVSGGDSGEGSPDVWQGLSLRAMTSILRAME